MRVTVIGPISKDMTIPAESVPFKSLGGIFYAVTTLKNIIKDPGSDITVSYLMKAFEGK